MPESSIGVEDSGVFETACEVRVSGSSFSNQGGVYRTRLYHSELVTGKLSMQYLCSTEDARCVADKLGVTLPPSSIEAFRFLLNKFDRVEIETDELVQRLFAADVEIVLIDCLMTYLETPEYQLPIYRRHNIQLAAFTPVSDKVINANTNSFWGW